MPTALGDSYEAGLGDTPETAAFQELLRTGKEAGLGLLRSPLDLAKGVVNTVVHPLDTLMGLGHTVAHPIEAVTDLAKHPREAGSLLGQMLLAPKVPEAANTVLAEGPGIVGRGISKVGRGMEAVGTSKALKSANKYGAIGTAVSGHPGLAALELAAPPALEYGGKLAQKGGAALEGLDLAYKGKIPTPFARDAEPAVVDPVEVMREKVAGAREDVGAGFSRKVASKLNGLTSEATDISHPTADVANPSELFPYQRDVIQGLKGARNSAAGDNAWANDASAIDPRDAGVRFSSKAEMDAAQPAPNAFTGKGAKLADTADAADELGSLMDALHGEDAPPVGNGTFSPLDRLARLSREGIARYDATRRQP